MYVEQIDTQLGPITVYANDEGVYSVKFGAFERVQKPNVVTHTARFELSAYFEGSLRQFTVPLDFGDAGSFQKRVWRILNQIPFGETRSYKEIAIALGDENAVRAVGNANGKNPIPIIIPCHRVIGSDKSLTGYASGIEMKRKLLSLENPKEYAYQNSLF